MYNEHTNVKFTLGKEPRDEDPLSGGEDPFKVWLIPSQL
jgi:hypothetical protein